MSKLSPTQRTLRALREQGRVAAVVEKWLPYADIHEENTSKKRKTNTHEKRKTNAHGKRKDLFGIIDVLALDPQRGVIGIQCCGSNFAEHWKKITEEKAQETKEWLTTPGTSLEIWAWRKTKLKRGGKAVRWTARIKEITLEDIPSSGGW